MFKVDGSLLAYLCVAFVFCCDGRNGIDDLVSNAA